MYFSTVIEILLYNLNAYFVEGNFDCKAREKFDADKANGDVYVHFKISDGMLVLTVQMDSCVVKGSERESKEGQIYVGKQGGRR